MPFDLGFLANREVSSDSKDFPLVLNSLWARSSKVLRRQEGKSILGLHYPTGLFLQCGVTERMESETLRDRAYTQ